MKHMSPMGRDFLQHLEGGGRPMMYLDQAGLPTIACGHLLTRDELASGKIGLTMYVPWHDGLSVEEMEELFRQDLLPAEHAINSLVRRLLTQNQFDALASFVFSVGVEAFRHSTLLKKINAGDLAAIPHEMARWIYSGGKIIEDLRFRRSREAALWNAIPEGGPPLSVPKEV